MDGVELAGGGALKEAKEGEPAPWHASQRASAFLSHKACQGVCLRIPPKPLKSSDGRGHCAQ